MVKKLLKCLEQELKNASVELRIDIGLAISHFQDEEIQNFLTKCFENVPAEKLRSRAFGHMMGEFTNGLVADMIRLSLEDDGVNPTDDDVIKQIGVRSKHIADQINNHSQQEQHRQQQIQQQQLEEQQPIATRQQFLASPDILRNISLSFLAQIGGTIYLDVKPDVGSINNRLLFNL